MLPEREQKFRILWLAGAAALSLGCYYQLLYHTVRTDFQALLFYFVILSVIYLLITVMVNERILYGGVSAALAIRILLLFAVPELSDDFYRFIWDGRLLVQGISPFASLPSELMQDPEFNQILINQQLYQGMNSAHYFTVYPPLAQWIFYFGAWLFPENILANLAVIRFIIILFEAGSLVLMVKLLQAYHLPASRVMIYAWNPLVIIELTGNLHFEAIMIFFVLLALYNLQKSSLAGSAVSMAAGVATKLVPLIFLPLLMFRLPWKKVIVYWVVCGTAIIGLFITIWSPALWLGMKSSLLLYFQKFEFNASIYYLVREVGMAIMGYNIIQVAGKYLALTTFLLILALSWKSRKLSWPQAMIWALTIYLVLSTTVHPWYVTPLVALTVFSSYRFPIAWSVLVILSYAGYTESGYLEQYWLVATEYILLSVVMFLDLKKIVEQKWVSVS